jgi:hypothetical protein
MPEGSSAVSKGAAKKPAKKSAMKSDFDTPQAKKSVKIKGPAESSGDDDDEDNSRGDAQQQNASPPWDVNASSSPDAKGHFDDSEDEGNFQTRGNNNDDSDS